MMGAELSFILWFLTQSVISDNFGTRLEDIDTARKDSGFENLNKVTKPSRFSFNFTVPASARISDENISRGE